MTNNDGQTTVPCTPQESALGLEEEVLEGVWGGAGWSGFVDSVKGCFGCGTKRAEKILASPSIAATQPSNLARQAGLVEISKGNYMPAPSAQGVFRASAR